MALLFCSPGPSAHAEIFDGSGFETIDWDMRIANTERAMGRDRPEVHSLEATAITTMHVKSVRAPVR